MGVGHLHLAQRSTHMSDHRNESPIDKVRDALDIDNDEHRHDSHGHDAHEHDTTEGRSSGWAGVGETLDPDVANRPAGPDYAAVRTPGEPDSVGDPLSDDELDRRDLDRRT